MVAASTTMMTGLDKDKYLRLKQSLMDPTQREEFTAENFAIRQAIWQDAKQNLGDVMADNSIPIEQRQAAVTGFMGQGSAASQYMSTTSNLAIQAIRADAGVNETASEEAARFSLLGTIEEINKQKLDRTAAINAIKMSNDQGTLGTIADVAELAAPFAEWIHVDDLLKEVSGERQTALMGEQKRRLYEAINKIPVDKRQEFTEFVIDTVTNNDYILLPDGNQIETIDVLENMLISNDYSDFERWFDNVMSVVDVSGLAGAIWKTVKGGARGGEAAGKAAKASKDPTKTKEAPKAKPGTEVGGLEGEVLNAEPTVVPEKPIALEGQIVEGEFTDVTNRTIEATSDATRSDVAPASPSQISKDVNPELAREMHDAAMADETGEIAEAAYGTNKTEAAAKDILPEPDTKAGKMENKVEMERPSGQIPEDIQKALKDNGNTAVSDAELAKVRKRLVANFENVFAMKLHPSSMLVRTNPDGTIGISAHYSPMDSGFVTPEDAFKAAEYGFREYGLTRDDFKLLARQGDKWVETSAKEQEAKRILEGAGAEGKDFQDIDFAIGVDYDYGFRPEDLEITENLTTAPGLISRIVAMSDRAPQSLLTKFKQGSIMQHALDPASVIDPIILNPASVAVDKVQGIKDLLADSYRGFADKYSKLKKDRRALMSDYLKEANRDELDLNVADLYSRGFTKDEIEMIKDWRRSADIMWHVANSDQVKNLRNKGMRIYVDRTSNTELIGKPLKREAVDGGEDIYDSASGTIQVMDRQSLNDLYEKGGEVMRLPEPMEVDGQWVNQLLVRNSPNKGFTRALKDDEAVLRYRKGYYPVMYDANYFIKMRFKVGRQTVVKTVASARDKGEVEHAIRNLQIDHPDAEFFRTDAAPLRNDTSAFFDQEDWGNLTNNGMTLQKHRGERLGDAGSDLYKMGHEHLKDPLEAVATQIHKLSQRVAMRDYLDTVKNRWYQNYGQYLELPKDEMFQDVRFPNSVSDIKGKQGVPEKLVQDARTNFNYIYSLENGYINTIDTIWKGAAHFGANLFAEWGLRKAERGMLSLSTGRPTQMAKSLAFNFFIAANPLRNAVIQRGQILQMMAINPTYFPSMLKDMIGLDMVRLGVSKNPKYVKLLKEIEDTGLLQAVDAHILIRKDTFKLADLTWGQKAMSVAKKPFEFGQKIGFDPAEQDVLIASYLTHRDMALKAGKKINNARERDKILGESRAFTLNMNRAGEMPYSQNTLSVPAQFFSFRHKAMLQPFTNRNLTKAQKAQLLATNLVLFGVDATLLYGVTDFIFGKEPSPEKDLFTEGLVDATLNKGLSLAAGEDVSIDFGDLASIVTGKP